MVQARQARADEVGRRRLSRHPVQEPLVGFIILADLEVDEEAAFDEVGSLDGRFARKSEAGTEACETKSASKERVVEEVVDV